MPDPVPVSLGPPLATRPLPRPERVLRITSRWARHRRSTGLPPKSANRLNDFYLSLNEGPPVSTMRRLLLILVAVLAVAVPLTVGSAAAKPPIRSEAGKPVKTTTTTPPPPTSTTPPPTSTTPPPTTTTPPPVGDCVGQAVTPGSDVQAAINAAPNGTTFCF